MTTKAEVVEKLAEELRLAYAEEEPTVRDHIRINHPWSGLDDVRKRKWRAMAEKALEVIHDSLPIEEY